MKRKITVIAICIALFVTYAFPTVSFATAVEAPELVAETAVLINAKTGEVLYDKCKDLQRYPASTTKVMTALLVLENLSLSDPVTVSHNAEYTEGSRIYLFEGEDITVEQALYAMMLESANDAAIALAETVAGSVEAFADMMNERAEELGAHNTHFVTPNGLPNEEHVTTAYDLALIAQEALKNEDFRKIVTTTSYTINPTNKQPEARTFFNRNKLLASTDKVTVNGVERQIKYEGITGVKTGYTVAAQSCLVASAERNGMEIIGVVLHSDPGNMYSDMISLLDYGFGNYGPVTILKAGDVVAESKVKGGKSKKVNLRIEEDVVASAELSADGEVADKSEFSYTLTTRELKAPVEEGKLAGTLTLYHDGTEAGTYNLYADEAVEESFFVSLLGGGSGNVSATLLAAAAMVVLTMLVVYMAMVINIRRTYAKRQELRKKMRAERHRRMAESNRSSDNVYDGNINIVNENNFGAETGGGAEAGDADAGGAEGGDTAGAGNVTDAAGDSTPGVEAAAEQDVKGAVTEDVMNAKAPGTGTRTIEDVMNAKAPGTGTRTIEDVMNAKAPGTGTRTIEDVMKEREAAKQAAVREAQGTVTEPAVDESAAARAAARDAQGTGTKAHTTENVKNGKTAATQTSAQVANAEAHTTGTADVEAAHTAATPATSGFSSAQSAADKYFAKAAENADAGTPEK